MTGGGPGEPTLAQVQARYPAWTCAQGVSGLYYAQNAVTGRQVTGEDPLDLSDQIKTAEARQYGPLIPLPALHRPELPRGQAPASP